MTYETGSLTSLDNVLDRLQVFLPVIGWTVDVIRSGAGEGDIRQMIFHNAAGQYFYVASNTYQSPGDGKYYDRLRARGIVSYTAGLSINDYPTADKTADWVLLDTDVGAVSNPTGIVPASYHFFGDADCLYIVVETRSNRYDLLTCQNLVKLYAWTGGAFIGGSNQSIQFWRDVADTRQCYYRYADAWQRFYNDFGTTLFKGYGSPDYAPFYGRAYRADIKARLLVPHIIWQKITSSTGFLSGQLRNAGIMRPEGLSPAQTIQIGAHNYMVFPGGTWPANADSNTTNCVIAIQKD